MCNPTTLKQVKPIVKEEEEVEILTTIDDYDVSEYLTHSENVNQDHSDVDGHAYHSNGETIVVNNDNA